MNDAQRAIYAVNHIPFWGKRAARQYAVSHNILRVFTLAKQLHATQ